MSFIEKIEYWHNRASDTKFVWFPFNSLMPSPENKIHMRLKIKMAIYFGIYYGLFASIRDFIISDSDLLQSLSQNLLIATLFFLVWFNVVTAPLWNMRAERLSTKSGEQKLNR